MEGIKVFLKLGELTDGSIKGLYKGGYEVGLCSYSFDQGIDMKGNAQTEVHGGAITINIPQLPSDELIGWSLDSRKYLSGVITVFDTNNHPLEKTFFENAACVNMKISYELEGKAYLHTQLIIQAQRIVIGGSKFESKWVI